MNKTRPSTFFWGLSFVLVLACVGELVRLRGFLLLDYAVPVLSGAWLINEMRNHRMAKLWADARWQWGLLFVLIGEASLVLHSQDMSVKEWVLAGLYGARFLAAFTLLFITESLNDEDAHRMRYVLALFLATLTGAGFLQLYFVPDFAAYEVLGWDPHQGRLLSTWFDPNFVGGALAFSLPWFLEGIWRKTEKKRVLIIGLCALLTAGILLTYSRSAYLAALVGVGLWSLRRSWRLTVAGLLTIAVLLSVSDRAQERVSDLINGAKSLGENSYTLPDPSARLRFESWREGWVLFADSPWIGQGMNRYSNAALHLGTMTDPNSHSATGSDSSLLNVLAMTGIFGAFAYAMMFIEILKRNPFFAFGLCGILIHSIFVNSLFFPLFLAPFWIFAARKIKNGP